MRARSQDNTGGNIMSKKRIDKKEKQPRVKGQKFNNFFTTFATRLVDNKWIVVAVLAVILILAIVGVFMVKKNGDVVSYLDKDTGTMIGKNVLQESYNIIGDLNIAISYLDKKQVGEIAEAIDKSSELGRIYVNKDHPSGEDIISKIAWLGTFDDLDPDNPIQLGNNIISSGMDPEVYAKLIENAKSNYVKTTQLSDGTYVDTYIVSVYFKTAGSMDVSIQAIKIIEDIIKDKINSLKDSGEISEILSVDECYFLGGQAQNARVLMDSSVNDMPIFVAIAVVAVFIILLFTTHSYFEPLIFLATLGVSILLNMGSNIVAGIPIGTISTITSSCATILQLALAMDYAIFLMHTYYEELKVKLNPRDAIISALPKTLKSIAASALTTIGGFVALFFMKFGMGYDLGFVLAKGVLLSLLTVIVLQPILILLCNKPIMKTQHRWIVEPRLKFVSKNITKKGVAAAVIALCAVVCLPCAYFQSKAPLSYISMSEYIPATNMSVPQYEMTASENQVILMVPYNESELSKQYQLIDRLKSMGVGNPDIHQINEIFSMCTLIDYEDMTEWLNSGNGSAIVRKIFKESFVSQYEGKPIVLYTMNLSGKPEDAQSYASLKEIRKISSEVFGIDEGAVYITGLAQGASDLAAVTPADFKLVNILSAVLIFIILLFTFRSFITSVILLAVIEAGIFFNLALVYFTSLIAVTQPAITNVLVSQINFMSYIIVSAIELGATVDYAILLNSKIEEEKKRGVEPMTAIKNGIYRAVPSVTTSAAILIAVCLAVKFVTSNIIVSQITELIARGTLFSYILTFTLLPAVLSIKERAHAAIRRRRGIVDTYEPELQTDYNEQAAAWKKERKAAAAAAWEREYGFVSVPKEKKPHHKFHFGKHADDTAEAVDAVDAIDTVDTIQSDTPATPENVPGESARLPQDDTSSKEEITSEIYDEKR